MIKVPEALQKKYNLLLMNSDIEPDQYGHCKKWLRYYLDFCKKYEHAYADAKSLLLFLEKLKKKKPGTFPAHTFRHSFASHLLQANYDIRTIQERSGHSDVRTTMIYTHTVHSRIIKETSLR